MQNVLAALKASIINILTASHFYVSFDGTFAVYILFYLPKKPWQTEALCWLQSGGEVEVVAIELRRLRCSDFEKKPMGVFFQRSIWFEHFIVYFSPISVRQE